MGWYAIARGLSYVAGPLAAGWLLLANDPATVFTLIGIISIVAFLPVVLMGSRVGTDPPGDPSRVPHRGEDSCGVAGGCRGRIGPHRPLRREGLRADPRARVRREHPHRRGVLRAPGTHVRGPRTTRRAHGGPLRPPSYGRRRNRRHRGRHGFAGGRADRPDARRPGGAHRRRSGARPARLPRPRLRIHGSIACRRRTRDRRFPQGRRQGRGPSGGRCPDPLPGLRRHIRHPGSPADRRCRRSAGQTDPGSPCQAASRILSRWATSPGPRSF